jgi:PAS domain S-box-containing protein
MSNRVLYLRRPRSIRFRLLLLLLVALVPLFLVRAGVYFRLLHLQYEGAVEGNQELARAAASGFHAYINDVAHQSQSIGMAMAFLEPPNSPQAQTFMVASGRQYPPVRAFHWVDPQGRVINSSNAKYLDLHIVDRPHFQQGLRADSCVLADLISSFVDGVPVFMLDRCIRDPQGAPLGVVVAIIDPAALEKEILKIGRAPGGRVMILDRQRRIVCSDPHLSLLWANRVVPDDGLIGEAIGGKDVVGVIRSPLDGKSMAVAYAPIGPTGWVAVASRPIHSIMAPLHEDMMLTGSVLLVVLGLSVGTALVISRQINRGVQGLREHAGALAEGQLDHRAEVTGIAELQAVAEAFNGMAARRQQAERALLKSQARLQALIENLPFDFWVSDATGKYTMINSVCRTHWGDLRGLRPEDVGVPPEVLAVWQSNNSRALAGELIKGEATYSIGGQERTYVNIQAPIRDGDRIYEIIGVNIDITDRKQAEETLRESEEKFRSLAENAQAIIGIIQGKHFIYANPYLARITGYSREELLAIDLVEMIHPSHRAMVLDRLQRRQQGETVPANYEFIMVIRDGTERWLNISLAAILYRGKPAVIGIAYDITDRKRAEQQLRNLNETLEQRVAERTAVAEQRASQLRSMAAELSLTEERERRRLAQVLHDDLQQLLAATKFHAGALHGRLESDAHRLRLAKVIDLLDQCISTSRSLTIELSPPILYDAGLPAGINWLARWMQSKHGLHVEVQVDEAANPAAEEVKVFLFQAARELLFNVVKHSGKRRTRAELHLRPNGQVQLIISDEGGGFDPARPRTTTGGGFGLFSIGERIELLGGHMEIDSSPGAGVRITLSVPVQMPERGNDTRAELGPQVPRDNSHGSGDSAADR